MIKFINILEGVSFFVKYFLSISDACMHHYLFVQYACWTMCQSHQPLSSVQKYYAYFINIFTEQLYVVQKALVL